jgi:hypothetical protein
VPITIILEEGEELRQLYADLPNAHQRAASALRTNGRPHDADLRHRFMIEDQKVSAIIQRIKEIQGTIGQHWMA